MLLDWCCLYRGRRRAEGVLSAADKAIPGNELATNAPTAIATDSVVRQQANLHVHK